MCAVRQKHCWLCLRRRRAWNACAGRAPAPSWLLFFPSTLSLQLASVLIMCAALTPNPSSWTPPKAASPQLFLPVWNPVGWFRRGSWPLVMVRIARCCLSMRVLFVGMSCMPQHCVLNSLCAFPFRTAEQEDCMMQASVSQHIGRLTSAGATDAPCASNAGRSTTRRGSNMQTERPSVVSSSFWQGACTGQLQCNIAYRTSADDNDQQA